MGPSNLADGSILLSASSATEGGRYGSNRVIAILDADVTNATALNKALSELDVAPTPVSHTESLLRASRLFIPPIPSIPKAVRTLRDRGLVTPLIRVLTSGVPVLAIDTGFHLLFDVCHDGGQHMGLGVIPGKVIRMEYGSHPAAKHFTLPHQGWNQVNWLSHCPIGAGLSANDYFYFDHAHHAEPLDAGVVVGKANHGVDFTAAAWSGSLFGTQFQPEKSKESGLRLLANFLAI